MSFEAIGDFKFKKDNKYENNRKLFDENLILYTNKDDDILIEVMKRGYIEMSQINLQLAEEYVDDISDYEAWLCGEWFFKWQLC